MTMVRCPLFVGVPIGIQPATLLPDGVVTRHAGRILSIRKGEHAAYVLPLGNLQTYRIYAVMASMGDIRRVYRWLKSKGEIAGPFTYHSAPTALYTFLESRPAPVFFGEDREALSAVGYVEGVDADSDAVMEV